LNPKKLTVDYSISGLILANILLVIFIASETASASVISELPTEFGNALDISPDLAGMIMSMGIIMSAAALLAIAKMKPIAFVFVILGLAILLTAMRWLNEVYIIFAGIVTAIYFGIMLKTQWG
jgi:hypothetical protein